MNLEQKIESYLFFKNEPVSKKELVKVFESSIEDIDNSIQNLSNNLSSRGIRLIQNESEVTLGTAPELSELFEKMRKDELSKELSKASLETLSIVFYRNGATRAEIEYIRGVQSSFILRNLTMRGLIEKTTHPDDSRKIIYKPTLDSVRFLGISNITQLPEFEQFSAILLDKEKELLKSMEEVVEENLK